MAWFRFVNYHSSAKILICCLYRLYTWNHINSSLSTFYLYQNIIFAQFCQPGCLVRSPSDVERYLLLRGGNRRRKLAIRPCCAWKWCGGCPKQGYPQSSSVLDWDFPNKNHPELGDPPWLWKARCVLFAFTQALAPTMQISCDPAWATLRPGVFRDVEQGEHWVKNSEFPTWLGNTGGKTSHSPSIFGVPRDT